MRDDGRCDDVNDDDDYGEDDIYMLSLIFYFLLQCLPQVFDCLLLFLQGLSEKRGKNHANDDSDCDDDNNNDDDRDVDDTCMLPLLCSCFFRVCQRNVEKIT